MSLFTSAVTLAAGQAVDVLLRQGRSIAGVVPQAVIQEHHTDRMTITQHPVEKGADISDHAYKMPSTVSMRCAWSKSGSLFNFGFGTTDADQVYKNLRAIQDARTPIDVVTGKRSYQNMLIKSLDVMTDAATENSLIIDAVFQQVIIVETLATTLPPSANMSMPQKTGQVQNGGTVQPKALPFNPFATSILNSAATAFGF